MAAMAQWLKRRDEIRQPRLENAGEDSLREGTF